MELIHFNVFDGSVTGYLHEPTEYDQRHKIRPALIVVPGGGYHCISLREADPVALEFLNHGFNVFVLTYSLGERAGAFHPLRELAEAVSQIREHAAEFRIDCEKVAVMGFSAGGHLACSLAVLWDDPELGLPKNCCPNAAVLCYPVITMGPFGHDNSRNYVTGGDPFLLEKLSLEKQVTPEMPPVFVWHAIDDDCVPVENSLFLVNALREAGVPFECHFFLQGNHGISTCNAEVERENRECREWITLCKNWLDYLFHFVS